MTQALMQSKFCRRVTQAILVAFSFQMQAHAANISNVPLATNAAGTARSNLVFIIDNSLSMASDYLPDAADYNNLCFGFHRTNYIFYNPNVIYTPPPNADGSPKPNATFNSAKDDGYSGGGGNTNLTNLNNLNTPSTRVGGTNANPINSKFYYATYNSNNPATPVCSGNNYDWTKWTIVTDASSWTATQQTNYANWWSYYRNRMLTMRAAVGQVMVNLDATRFRVGYSAINDYQYNNSSGFLRIGDYDGGTQKSDFYTKLYAQAPSVIGTPLRPALEKIGKYYAGRQLNGSALPNGADPLQYSCQRNFAILTTDGYWNTAAQPAGYSPTRLDGSTAIGNTDSGNSIPRPRRDDGRIQGNNWTTGGSGVSNTLADIAEYFFDTDLRDSTVAGTNCTSSIAGQNLCTNNVGYENPPINLPVEQVKHQRMTTYTLGLGVSGNLTWQSDYDTATSGDFYSIRNGSLAWPDPDVANTAWTVNTRVDDLWHTAVNGRGRYYSAANAADVVLQLASALDNITAATGTSAAAATSSQRPVNGDNFAFVGQYTTVSWSGNLKALTLDPATGVVSNTALWEAKNTVKAQVASNSDTRAIYFRDSSVAVTNLANFTYANLNTAGRGADFTNACQVGNFKLSQCASLSVLGAPVLTAANDGTNLVNYLRGRTGNEQSTANAITNRLFRERPTTPLGDIVNAAPAYVRAPPFLYTDNGYNTFKTNNATRQAMVYAAANDGMLHAFNATTGAEVWAYVPTVVMPNMWRLADANYDTGHRYFVDGTPVIGDVYDGTNWRTILVGGLGAGGRGYYALDITNPASPKSLWEFTVNNDNDLGFTFGNPVITKNKAGTWVVAFSSGYNNVSPGNGNGHLFVVNAVTGASIAKVSTYTSGTTPAGTAGAPSDLGKINPWIDAESNNTAKRFYGGDMLGYMWRFDFDDNIAPNGNEAMILGRALDGSGNAQPITTRPVPVKVGNVSTIPVVAFGTGRYLGAGDIGDTSVQSLYVVKDSLAANGLGTLRSNATMVQQSMNASRVVTAQPVDWAVKNGWYIDFTGTPAGERLNVDMVQTGKLLGLATNQPEPSACNSGGNSVLYFFDITTGGLTDNALTYTTLTAGLNLILIGETLKIIRFDTVGNSNVTTPTSTSTSGSTVRRTSWRELAN